MSQLFRLHELSDVAVLLVMVNASDVDAEVMRINNMRFTSFESPRKSCMRRRQLDNASAFLLRREKTAS